MQIYQRPLSDIKPYEKNPRQKYDIQKVAQSIKEFGFQQPIVVDRAGVIIVGHGRYQASKSLGLETVPVVIADLSPEKAKAYRIADNKTNEYSDWDIGLLTQEFTDLLDINYDLELTGFDADELEKLIVGEKEGLTDEDAVPETPKEPKAQLGDIYKLGEHRLMCGDSTSIDAIEKLLDGTRPDMVFTDPPYNINQTGGGKSEIAKRLTKLKSDIDFISDFDPKDFLNILPIVFEQNKMNSYIFCNKDLLPEYLIWAKQNKYSFNVLVWKKPSALPIKDAHKPDIEYLLFFRKSAIWNPSQKNVNYSRVIEEKRELGLHPTMKPISIIENQLKISSNISSKVLDFFGGSGSTLIACEKTNRKCYMMELDPKYIDVIIKRWEQYTGQKAEKIN